LDDPRIGLVHVFAVSCVQGELSFYVLSRCHEVILHGLELLFAELADTQNPGRFASHDLELSFGHV
jgi:hypothetical protein